MSGFPALAKLGDRSNCLLGVKLCGQPFFFVIIAIALDQLISLLAKCDLSPGLRIEGAE
jgi:hypothetical protein